MGNVITNNPVKKSTTTTTPTSSSSGSSSSGSSSNGGIFSFLFGGSPTANISKTTTTTSETPAWYQDLSKQIVAKADALASQPYQAYSGPTVAPATADQNSAYAQVRGNVGNYQPALNSASASNSAMTGINAQTAVNPYLTKAGQSSATAAVNPYLQQADAANGSTLSSAMPYFDQAAGTSAAAAAQPYLNQASQTATGTNLDGYMSPYTKAVTDQIATLGNRNLQENILPGIGDTFTSNGQYGSGRNAQIVGRAVRDTQDDITAQQASALQSGYANAQTAFDTDAARQASLAQTAGGLANQDATLQSNIGTNVSNILGNQATTAANLGSTAAGAAGTDATTALNSGTIAGNAATAQQNALNNATTNSLNIGTDTSKLGLADATALDSVGTEQQNLNQKNLTQAQTDFSNQNNYNEQQLQYINNLLKGTNTGMTTTTANADNSSGNNFVSALGNAASLFSNNKAKGGLVNGKPKKGADIQSAFDHLADGGQPQATDDSDIGSSILQGLSGLAGPQTKDPYLLAQLGTMADRAAPGTFQDTFGRAADARLKVQQTEQEQQAKLMDAVAKVQAARAARETWQPIAVGDPIRASMGLSPSAPAELSSFGQVKPLNYENPDSIVSSDIDKTDGTVMVTTKSGGRMKLDDWKLNNSGTPAAPPALPAAGGQNPYLSSPQSAAQPVPAAAAAPTSNMGGVPVSDVTDQLRTSKVAGPSAAAASAPAAVSPLQPMTRDDFLNFQYHTLEGGKPEAAIDAKANPGLANLLPDMSETDVKDMQNHYWRTGGVDKVPLALQPQYMDAVWLQGKPAADQLLQQSGGTAPGFLAARQKALQGIAAADPAKAKNLGGWLSRANQVAQVQLAPDAAATQVAGPTAATLPQASAEAPAPTAAPAAPVTAAPLAAPQDIAATALANMKAKVNPMSYAGAPQDFNANGVLALGKNGVSQAQQDAAKAEYTANQSAFNAAAKDADELSKSARNSLPALQMANEAFQNGDIDMKTGAYIGAPNKLMANLNQGIKTGLLPPGSPERQQAEAQAANFNALDAVQSWAAKLNRVPGERFSNLDLSTMFATAPGTDKSPAWNKAVLPYMAGMAQRAADYNEFLHAVGPQFNNNVKVVDQLWAQYNAANPVANPQVFANYADKNPQEVQGASAKQQAAVRHMLVGATAQGASLVNPNLQSWQQWFAGQGAQQ